MSQERMDMNLAQENFERALDSGYSSLATLAAWQRMQPSQQLSNLHVDILRTLAWDLEAIQTAIRMELNNRSANPVDMA